MGDPLVPGLVAPEPPLMELSKSLKRQFEDTVHLCPRKVINGVQFQMPEQEWMPKPSSEQITVSLQDASCIKRDFCDVLRECLRQPMTANKCLEASENTLHGRHLL